MTARRGRPPQYDRNAALEAIVGAFLARGFAATSLDDLARDTGMNRPSLFAAFGNKKAMYLAALDRFRDRMAAAVGAAIGDAARGPSRSARDVAVAMLDAAADLYASTPSGGCLVFCTAPAAAAHDADIRAHLAATLAAIRADIAAVMVGVGTAAGHDAEPGARADAVVAMLMAVAIQSRAGMAPDDLRRFIRSGAAALG